MIELKKWIIDYAEDIAKHANNEKIAKNLMDIFPHPYTFYDAKAVGSISITLGTDIHSKTCEIGYWLGEDYWNKGIMKKAIKQICAMAFEGKLRNAIYKNDKIYDGLMYARISDDDK